MRFRHVIAVSAVALASASCSLGGPEEAGSMNLYLSVDKGTLPIDESMTITVTARNVGFDPLTLNGPSNCLLYVDVVDNQGRVLWSSNGTCSTQIVSEQLLAGTDKVQDFTWDGKNLAGARLASGYYYIRGVARLVGGAYIGPPLSISIE